MTATTTKSAYWSGARNGMPYIGMVIPFALLFGVIEIEAGLSREQTMIFSVLVIAGATQSAALQLMLDDEGINLILLSALAVNLRVAIYAAALATHFGAHRNWIFQ